MESAAAHVLCPVSMTGVVNRQSALPAEPEHGQPGVGRCKVQGGDMQWSPLVLANPEWRTQAAALCACLLGLLTPSLLLMGVFSIKPLRRKTYFS